MIVPKVSVLTPVYNTKEVHLRECIESILSQTYLDFEFIILNDASSDKNVEEVVKSYNDSRIVYAVNEKNLGISKTRNRLLKMAKGEYLAIFDHDDISMPERLQVQVAYLDSHPEVGCVGSWAKIFGEKERIYSVPEESSDIKKKLLKECCVIHSACMIRKSVLDRYFIQYEDNYSPAEDYALFCRLVGKTEFYNFQKSLILYRNHEGNTTHRRLELMKKNTIAIQSFVRRNNPDLWDLVRLDLFRKRRILLFKFIPILKIEEYLDRTDIYLFSKIPLLSIKTEAWREE